MKSIFTFLLCLAATLNYAQIGSDKLLGVCSENDLRKAPFDTWYVKNYDDYLPNQNIISQLKSIPLSNWQIKIFFGTWCGDTKRELPRMMKVLETIHFPKNNISLIAVDNKEEAYKQSPSHEEKGMSIYRVPTFVFYEKNKEIARINEISVESLERDLLSILKKLKYIPNYPAHTLIDKWLKLGLLSDENISANGLARQIKNIVASEAELNACGYVLMARNELKEAVNVFRINVNLYPQSANCYDSLAEGYLKIGQKSKAISMYERAFDLDPHNKATAEKIEKLKKESMH
jgi:tetratricopeptide (TPR) repeat protein